MIVPRLALQSLANRWATALLTILAIAFTDVCIQFLESCVEEAQSVHINAREKRLAL